MTKFANGGTATLIVVATAIPIPNSVTELTVPPLITTVTVSPVLLVQVAGDAPRVILVGTIGLYPLFWEIRFLTPAALRSLIPAVTLLSTLTPQMSKFVAPEAIVIP